MPGRRSRGVGASRWRRDGEFAELHQRATQSGEVPGEHRLAARRRECWTSVLVDQRAETMQPTNRAGELAHQPDLVAGGDDRDIKSRGGCVLEAVDAKGRGLVTGHSGATQQCDRGLQVLLRRVVRNGEAQLDRIRGREQPSELSGDHFRVHRACEVGGDQYSVARRHISSRLRQPRAVPVMYSVSAGKWLVPTVGLVVQVRIEQLRRKHGHGNFRMVAVDARHQVRPGRLVGGRVRRLGERDGDCMDHRREEWVPCDRSHDRVRQREAVLGRGECLHAVEQLVNRLETLEVGVDVHASEGVEDLITQDVGLLR